MTTNDNNILICISNTVEYIEISALLFRGGYSVFIESNAKRGLQILTQNNINLVVIDILLSVQEEVDFIFSVRKINPELEIILLTNNIQQILNKIRNHLFFCFNRSISKEALLQSIIRVKEHQQASIDTKHYRKRGSNRKHIQSKDDGDTISIHQMKRHESEKIKAVSGRIAISELYQLMREVLNVSKPSKEVFCNLLLVISSIWKKPERICARITYEDINVTTANFQETEWKMSQNLIFKGGLISKLEMFNLENNRAIIDPSFYEDDVSWIELIGATIGFFNERQQILKILQQSKEELAIIEQISNIFRTVIGNDLYSELLKVILESLKSPLGVFGYIDEDGSLVCPTMTEQVWDQCQMTDKTLIFPRELWGDSIWAKSMIEERTVRSNDHGVVPDGHLPISRAISVPIIFRGEVIGHICISNKPTDYNERDEQLLETIADHIAPILHLRLQKTRREKEQKKNEEQIRFQLMLLDQVRNAVIAINIKGEIIYWNKYAETLYQWKQEEVLGNQLPDTIIPNRGVVILEGVMEKIKEFGRWEGEFSVLRKNGSEFPVIVTGTIIKNDLGSIVGFVFVSFDISYRKEWQNALEESERRYRRLVECFPDGVFVLIENRFVFVNDAGVKLLGAKNPIEILGKTLDEFVSQDSLELLNCAAFEEVANTKTTEPWEQEVVLFDGSKALFMGFSTGIVYDNKDALQIVARDVTQIKRLTRSLIEERSQLLSVFSALDEPIFVIDPLNHKILYENEKSKGIFSKKITNKSCYEVIYNRDSPCNPCICNTCLHQEIEIHRNDELNPISGKYYLVTRKVMNWISKKDAVLLMGIDITERKDIEETLKKSEEKLKSITDVTQDIFLRLDLDSIIIYINKAGLSLFGRPKEEIIGSLFREFLHPDEIDTFQSLFPQFQEEEEISLNCKMFTTRGIRIIKWRSTPFRDKRNNMIGIQLTGSDVTEEQKRIEEERRLATIGQLAAGVAHELNTPLANIQLTAEYMMKLITTTEYLPSTYNILYEELFDIKEQVNNCAQIVKNLLMFSRRITINPKRFNARSFFIEIMTSPAISSKFKEKNVDLILKVEENKYLFGDREQLFQVFLNVITNSLDAFVKQSETCVVTISLFESLDFVEILVKDNGKGIPEEDLLRIFEPFFTTKKVGSGTGLGLSICKGIIDKHNGRIEVKSCVNEGTEIKILLPC